MVGQQRATFQFLPIECGVTVPGGEEESIALVDLRKVYREL